MHVLPCKPALLCVPRSPETPSSLPCGLNRRTGKPWQLAWRPQPTLLGTRQQGAAAWWAVEQQGWSQIASWRTRTLQGAGARMAARAGQVAAGALRAKPEPWPASDGHPRAAAPSHAAAAGSSWARTLVMRAWGAGCRRLPGLRWMMRARPTILTTRSSALSRPSPFVVVARACVRAAMRHGGSKGGARVAVAVGQIDAGLS